MTQADFIDRQSFLAWRRYKSAYERERVARKRAADPQWWANYLARNAAYRRNRAAVDPAYRLDRNMQAK